MFVSVAASLIGAILIAWLALVVGLFFVRPKNIDLKEIVRLLPDVLRLLHRLAKDKTLPFDVRFRLYLLFIYLAFPIDIIPDFIPVIGYADDAIIVLLILRGVVRRSGVEALVRHWPGSKDGLLAVARLAGIKMR